jgi:hypothetical protein
MSKTLCVCVGGGVLVVIKCIYLPLTYLHFIQDIDDRCLLLTSSMSFCCFTILGTSDDRKALYGPKSIHIFIMSKTRGSHRQFDMRRRRGTKPGPNQTKVGRPAPPLGWPARVWCLFKTLLQHVST